MISFGAIEKKYVWGSERWDIADRKEGTSVVVNGPFAGKTLQQLVLEMKEELLGVGRKWDRFPLLLKRIDAEQNLSLQVHPDEKSARTFNGEAKSEMWLMLNDASVYASLKKGVDTTLFQRAIEQNRAQDLVEKWDVKSGDMMYIPAGVVHGICAGSLLYEIQQNSNTTYRLYDWGRVGRELHLQDGLSAIHWQSSVSLTRRVCNTPFFHCDLLDVVGGSYIEQNPKTFQIFFCMRGCGHIIVDSDRQPLEQGMTYLVPAVCKSISFEGRCQLLRTILP